MTEDTLKLYPTPWVADGAEIQDSTGAWVAKTPNMRLTRYITQEINKASHEPSTYIQWKGTDVCIDIHCPNCGLHGHVDGDFVYAVKCCKCGSVWQLGENVSLTLLTDESVKGSYLEHFKETAPIIHDEDICGHNLITPQPGEKSLKELIENLKAEVQQAHKRGYLEGYLAADNGHGEEVYDQYRRELGL